MGLLRTVDEDVLSRSRSSSSMNRYIISSSTCSTSNDSICMGTSSCSCGSGSSSSNTSSSSCYGRDVAEVVVVLSGCGVVLTPQFQLY